MRELRNLVERAIVMSPDGVLRLPDVLAGGPAVPDREPPRSDLGRASLVELMLRYKARLIRTAMERSGGNQRRAAELLGIHRPSLTHAAGSPDVSGPAVRRRPAACRPAC